MVEPVGCYEFGRVMAAAGRFKANPRHDKLNPELGEVVPENAQDC